MNSDTLDREERRMLIELAYLVASKDRCRCWTAIEIYGDFSDKVADAQLHTFLRNPRLDVLPGAEICQQTEDLASACQKA